jgi:DNA-binding NarL/FixJ family response regulator
MGPKIDSLKVLLVDDHALFRQGMRALLDNIQGIEIIGEAGDGREAISMVRSLAPNLVLMDISMPELNGLEATAQIISENKKVRVMLLSMNANEEFVVQAFKAGASGYLLKNSSLEELNDAIANVAQGGTYISPAISRHLAAFIREPVKESPLEGLTSRQREILQLLAEGYTNSQIAAKLHISVKTVETHRSRLMQKLGIHDVPGLVRFAIRMGLVAPED